MTLTEVVYKGRDNPNSITVEQDGLPLDFSAVTRMTCAFTGSATVADSDENSSLFDWDQGGGKIEFNFNDLDIPAGNRHATLIAYDPVHPDGQVIAHECGADLRFRFVD
jgi:hypothetical protein